jgi:signal transduction histidine kinase
MEAKKERDQIRDDEARTRRSAQQLLDINRLKSEFIVKSGRELESALTSLLASAEMLERGEYGGLNEDQSEAIKGICAWARHMKGDVAWMVEYSATRSPRPDASEPSAQPLEVEPAEEGEPQEETGNSQLAE